MAPSARLLRRFSPETLISRATPSFTPGPEKRTQPARYAALTCAPMPDIVFHDQPRFPRGFRCASRLVGLKTTGKDLSLFASEVDAAAAAVFTRNHFPGAPVILGRETIRGGRLRGIVVNSKVSNVATGARGIADARRMAAAAAVEIGTSPDRVL